VEIRLFTLAMIPNLRYCFHAPSESAPSIEDGAYEKEVPVHDSAYSFTRSFLTIENLKNSELPTER